MNIEKLEKLLAEAENGPDEAKEKLADALDSCLPELLAVVRVAEHAWDACVSDGHGNGDYKISGTDMDPVMSALKALELKIKGLHD